MSLLDDVSIVVTPNGYKAGELYAVIPVPTEGAEEVTNGDFATDISDWYSGASASLSWDASLLGISNNSTSYNSYAYQNFTLVAGKDYLFTADIVSDSQGSGGTKRIWVTETASDATILGSTTTSGIGSYSVQFTATGATRIRLGKGSNSGVTVYDNVSLKEVTSADMDVTRATAATRVDENGLVNYAEVLGGEEVTDGNFPLPNTNWILGGSGSNIPTIGTNDVAINSVDSNSYIQQSGILTSGKYYKITYDVISASATSNVLKLASSFGLGSIPTSVGTQIVYGTAITSTLYIERYTNGVNATITNVSVKEVTRDNVPRIDYTGGGCPHILAEPQRTNLIQYSEDLTQWNIGNSTISPNDVTSPDGTQNADTITVPDTNDFIYEGATTIASTEYVFSFYVKRGTIAESALKLAVRDDTNSAWIDVDVSYSSSDSEWTRITQSFTTPVGCILIRAYAFRNASSTLGTFSVWGAQVEQGSYATSYIPNFGTAAGVTRNQDIFTRDGIGSLIGSEGVLFVEMAALSDDGTNRGISLNDGTATNRLLLYFSAASNQIAVISTGFAGSIIYTLPDETSFNKIAVRYKANDITLWVDGESRGTPITSATIPTFTALKFDSGSLSSPFFGKVKQLQVYDTALTDEQLEALTT